MTAEAERSLTGPDAPRPRIGHGCEPRRGGGDKAQPPRPAGRKSRDVERSGAAADQWQGRVRGRSAGGGGEFRDTLAGAAAPGLAGCVSFGRDNQETRVPAHQLGGLVLSAGRIRDLAGRIRDLARVACRRGRFGRISRALEASGNLPETCLSRSCKLAGQVPPLERGAPQPLLQAG